jgi:hypothetical protein
MLPAPVVAEYLAGFPEDEQASQASLIEQLFFVPAFDLRAAEVAAQLRTAKRGREALKELAQSGQMDKPALSTDLQIIAIAIVQKAEFIISHDAHFPKLAQGRMKMQEVPTISEQQPLKYPEAPT